MKTEYAPSGERMESLRQLCALAASRTPDGIFIREQRGDSRISYTFQKFASDVEALQSALALRFGRTAHVLLLGKNGYTWALCAMTLLSGAGVLIPVDRTLSECDLAATAKACDADAILFSPDCAAALSLLPSNITRISFDELPTLIAEGRRNVQKRHANDAARAPDDLCMLLPTPSVPQAHGTPVMLSERNLCFGVTELSRVLPVDGADTFLSILPMHHLYELTASLLLPLYVGATVAFGDGLRALTRSMRELEPTAIVCVPPVLQALHARLQVLLSGQKNAKTLTRTLKMLNSLPQTRLRDAARRRALQPLYELLGGRLRLLLCNGICDPAAVVGLRELGIDAYSCYVVNECAPFAALSREDAHKDDSLGTSLPNAILDVCDMQEDGTGKIRCKSDGVMLGYYKAPELTHRVKHGGWLYTGDTGYLDDDGFLYLTGSARNTILRTSGQSVSPEELEPLLLQSPYIAECVTVGYLNPRKNDYDVVALLYPDYAQLESLYGQTPSRTQIDLEMRRAISSVNIALPAYKRIKRYLLCAHPFPKTPSGKPRRALIAEEYRELYRKKFLK